MQLDLNLSFPFRSWEIRAFPQAFRLAAWTCSLYLLRKNKHIRSSVMVKMDPFQHEEHWVVSGLCLDLLEAPVPGQQRTLASAARDSDNLLVCPVPGCACFKSLYFHTSVRNLSFSNRQGFTPTRGFRGPLHIQWRFHCFAETGTH